MVIFYAFLSAFLVSGATLVAAVGFLLKKNILERCTTALVGIAVGALLGNVFAHIVPEAYAAFPGSSIPAALFVAGILAFFLLERVMHWHHHAAAHAEEYPHPKGPLLLASAGVHSFIDGLVLAASYQVSIEVGFAMTVAILLHEIPQKIGSFGVFLHAGYSVARAMKLNILSALTAAVGVVAAFIAGSLTASLAPFLLPIAGGGFLYVALSDLIPELRASGETRRLFFSVIAVVLGSAAMFFL